MKVIAPVNRYGGDQVTLYAQWTKRKGEVTTEKEVNKQKYIKYNPDDDTYDLTLNITGAYGTEMNKNEVEIVLLIDDSNSMYDDLMPKVKDAINNYLVAEINNELNKEKPTIDVRWKILKFDSSASYVTSNWIETRDVAEKVNSINSKSGRSDGGTNYYAGFNLAQTALNSKYSGFKNPTRIVIWFTDGVPTFHGKKESGGGHYCNQQDYAGAISGAQGLSCDQFYAIGYGLTDSTGCENYEYRPNYEKDENYHTNTDSSGRAISGRQIFNNVADTVPAGKTVKKDINNANQLETVFSDIAGDIKSLKCTNVTIEDQLSDMVDILDGANAKLTITAKYNKTDGLGEDQSQTAEAGTPDTVRLDFKSKKTDIATEAITATIDRETKTVKLSFRSDYELDPDYTFAVTLTIESSQGAYEKYEEKGSYPNIGAKNTDDPDATYLVKNENGEDTKHKLVTSSEQPGFNSNNEAKVSYKYNSDTSTEEKYEHPVVQVYPGKLVIQKEFKGVDGEDLLDKLKFAVTFTTITYDDKGNEVKTSRTCTIPFNNSNFTKGEDGIWVSQDKVTYEESKDNSKLDLTRIAKGTFYRIEEKGADLDGYTMSADDAEITSSKRSDIPEYVTIWTLYGDDHKQEIGKNEIETYKITNTYALETKTIKIVKYEGDSKNGGIPLEGMEFTLKAVDGSFEETNYISNEAGLLVPELELPYGDYELSEVASDKYYNLDTIKFTVSDGGIEITEGADQCTIATGEDGLIILNVYNKKVDAEVQILKVADGSADEPLAGAEFTLKYVDENKVETDVSNGVIESGKGTTGADGILKLGRLEAGTYILREVKAPDGYLVMKDDITITVSKDGEVVKVDVKTANPNAGVVVSDFAKDEDGNYILDANGDKIIQIQVSNSSGTELPETGGSGTRWYTFGGIAIIAIGLVFGFSMRRMRERRLR